MRAGTRTHSCTENTGSIIQGFDFEKHTKPWHIKVQTHEQLISRLATQGFMCPIRLYPWMHLCISLVKHKYSRIYGLYKAISLIFAYRTVCYRSTTYWHGRRRAKTGGSGARPSNKARAAPEPTWQKNTPLLWRWKLPPMLWWIHTQIWTWSCYTKKKTVMGLSITVSSTIVVN